MAVQSVLTYDPATVTRLANTLTALSSLPADTLARDHNVHSLLTQLGKPSHLLLHANPISKFRKFLLVYINTPIIVPS